MSNVDDLTVPNHIAIVMDGNGRWATAQNKIRVKGHKKGMEAARDTIENCARAGVNVLTLFAFSSENWRRPEDEVNYLMSLFIEGLSREAKTLLKNDIQLEVIGERSQFSEKLQKAIIKAEQLTQHCKRMKVYVAANYGGRWDIINAARQILKQENASNIETVEVDEENFSKYLSLAEVPDPDLFIRTGGEHRISNFLIWQLAYSELYFSDILWPDFDKVELEKAIKNYSGRQRRFGKTGQQVADSNNVDSVQK